MGLVMVVRVGSDGPVNMGNDDEGGDGGIEKNFGEKRKRSASVKTILR